VISNSLVFRPYRKTLSTVDGDTEVVHLGVGGPNLDHAFIEMRRAPVDADTVERWFSGWLQPLNAWQSERMAEMLSVMKATVHWTESAEMVKIKAIRQALNILVAELPSYITGKEADLAKECRFEFLRLTWSEAKANAEMALSASDQLLRNMEIEDDEPNPKMAWRADAYAIAAMIRTIAISQREQVKFSAKAEYIGQPVRVVQEALKAIGRGKFEASRIVKALNRDRPPLRENQIFRGIWR